jgi:APA family basic amino acid/polyamine antiporter
MIQGGAVAAVGITFAEYALRSVGSNAPAAPLAIAAIVIVSAINYVGVKPGSRVLNVFVILKMTALVALIIAGALLAEPSTTAVAEVPERSGLLILAFGAALVPVMFSYGGWQSANWISEEIREPERNLPRAIIAGTLAVIAVYVLVNMIYLRALGHAGLAATTTPAADTAARAAGPVADRLIALAIAVSTFGFLHLCVLAPTRVYYAMAADGVFFRGMARLHPRFRTPSLAIVTQSGWAIVLALTGTYGDLVDYVVFADWLFFGMSVLALFVLRRQYPLHERQAGTYRSPGYPLIPVLFLVAAALVIVSVVWSNPLRSATGAILLLTGVPAYMFWTRRGKGD